MHDHSCFLLCRILPSMFCALNRVRCAVCKYRRKQVCDEGCRFGEIFPKNDTNFKTMADVWGINCMKRQVLFVEAHKRPELVHSLMFEVNHRLRDQVHGIHGYVQHNYKVGFNLGQIPTHFHTISHFRPNPLPLPFDGLKGWGCGSMSSTVTSASSSSTSVISAASAIVASAFSATVALAFSTSSASATGGNRGGRGGCNNG